MSPCSLFTYATSNSSLVRTISFQHTQALAKTERIMVSVLHSAHSLIFSEGVLVEASSDSFRQGKKKKK